MPVHSNLATRSSRHLMSFSVLAFVGAYAGTFPAMAQTLVHKVAEPFETESWVVSDDSRAGGSVKLVPDSPTEIRAFSSRSMDLEADFSGQGFEYFSAVPRQPVVIPGVTRSVALWVRTDGQPYNWTLMFRDGWGRTEANGQKLMWEVFKGAGRQWKQITFKIPAGWVQPLSLDSVFVHNWDAQSKKASVHCWMDRLEVETDISGVDPQTGALAGWQPNPQPAKDDKTGGKPPVTPLLTASLSATQQYNVFCGVAPEFSFRAQNWKSNAAVATLKWKLSDYHDAVLKQGVQDLKVEDIVALSLPMDVQRFGLYHLDSSIAWQGGAITQSSQPFAVIPVPHELTDAEKDASPYGLNVLSARQPMAATFRKAGIIWYRDYGFNYEWMVRAKGTDKSYGGWPWYPKIIKQYEASGVRVLANLQTAIKPPVPGAPPGPSRAWTREMVGILSAFPSVYAYELDNEYDLGSDHIKAETPIQWKNYLAYHKKFGDILHLLGDEQSLAVENGRAGIWPERERQAVQSGQFAPIDVINSHHYTGVEPPEINVINHNMGIDNSEAVLMLYDQLRAAKKMGATDGKLRQHWLTEFGWDTKAGPVVSSIEQAAYLQRMYMMLSAAVTEKGFWFFDLDATTANQFFDGCGLFTYDQLPKLSYVAYAGLTQLLPKPECLGLINAGEGTWGYLFRNEGKLVAALWSLNGEKRPVVDFGGAQLYDFLGNPIEKGKVQLGIEPVYAVGVPEESPWFRQATYGLESPYLVAVTAGDSVTADLQVRNNRKTAISGKVQLQLPAGWKNSSGDAAVAVDPGKTADYPLTFRVGLDEPLGEKTVRLAISEDAPLETIPLRVQIQRPILMTVRGLAGEPGAGQVTVRLSNRSAQPLDGTLRFKLPSSWSTATPELKVVSLKPRDVRDVQSTVNWSADWKPGESAIVEYTSEDGRSVQQPLIPSRLTIHHVADLPLDGDPAHWPAGARVPAWVLGSTAATPDAAVYLGWSEKGLYVAVDVQDSKVLATDPRSFWIGDVLEMFIDTHDRKTSRQYGAGDHQIWMVPQVDRKRVYVGQWKRGGEIAETKFDVPGIHGTAVPRGDGYFMECLIPAAMINGYQPVVGTRMGLNLNLSVKGARVEREVFWTRPKLDGAADHPETWGTVILGP